MKFAISIGLIFWPALVLAEPGTSVKWLMDRPVSLFDLGVQRMNDDAARAADALVASHTAPAGPFTTGSAFYDWDTNEIRLQIISAIGDQKPADAQCKKLRGEFVSRLIMNFNAKNLKADTTRYLGQSFSHQGYEEKGRDPQLEEKLSAITHASALVIGSGSVECEGRLAEAEPSYKRADH